MGLWQRLFGDRSLARIDRPTRVNIEGHVISDNDAVGLMTGMRGAVVEVQFTARYMRPGRTRHEADQEVFEVIGTFLTDAPLRVRCEGGDVLVPTRGMTIRFPGDDHGVPVDRPVPPELAKVLGSADAIGRMVYYRELALSRGDKVRLDATIAPSTEVEADGYRGTTSRGFVARPDLSPICVEDRSLDDP
jgi:hypothetical protein